MGYPMLMWILGNVPLHPEEEEDPAWVVSGGLRDMWGGTLALRVVVMFVCRIHYRDLRQGVS